MPLSFPGSPTANQVYTDSSTNKSWEYDGSKWIVLRSVNSAGIATPSISSPADNATGVDDTQDLTVTSSTFASSSGEPGSHFSSTWEIVKGAEPLVSDNLVTSTTLSNANWAATNLATDYTSSAAVRGIAYDPVNDRIFLGGYSNFNGGNPHDGVSAGWYSDDGGVTWTDTSSNLQLNSNSSDFTISNVNFDDGWFWCQLYGKKTDGGSADGLMVSQNATSWNKRQVNIDTYNGLGVVGVFADYLYMRSSNSGNGRVACSSAGTTQPSGFNPTNSWGNPKYYEMAVNQAGNVGLLFTEQNGKYYRNTSTSSPGTWTAIDESANITSFVAKCIYSTTFSMFILALTNGTIHYSTDGSGGSWSTATNSPLGGYNLTSIVDDGEKIIFSNNTVLAIADNATLSSWSSLQTHSTDNTQEVKVSDGAGTHARSTVRYLNDTRDSSSNTNFGYSSATNIVNKLELTVSGAKTKGFDVGQQIINRGGLSASGTISTISDSSITLFPYAGTWSANSTQKVATENDSYNFIVDSVDDTVNLTTYVIPSSILENASTYRVRVRYNSENNVTSGISDWSTFST